jgi:nucleoside-diphosphate-sugar epimerase
MPMNEVEFEVAGARILVTGASGLIGGGLARRLTAAGAEVRALVRRPDAAPALRAEGMDVAVGDLTDPASLARAVKGCDAVAHFAGVLGDEAASWARFMAVNVHGTRSLVVAAVEARVRRFLFASSVWACGFDAGPGTDETSPAGPCGDPYCDTKLVAQALVLDAARRGEIAAVVIQPSPVYGPHDDAWTATPLRLLRLHLLAVPGRNGGMIQPLYVADAVEGSFAALTRGESGEVYILCGAQELTIRRFFRYYTAMGTRQQQLPSVPRGVLSGAAGVAQTLGRIVPRAAVFTRTAVAGTALSATYSGRKAREQLGFVPRTGLDEGMAAVRAWAVDEGLL